MEVKAHKVILARVSEFFRQAFEGGFKVGLREKAALRERRRLTLSFTPGDHREDY